MLYWSRECVCITACRSKKRAPACTLGSLRRHGSSLRLLRLLRLLPPSVSLVGSFNESQFPAECHITPLNDLIKQSQHLLSPAISLFTTASTAVTQFPPSPPPSLALSLLPPLARRRPLGRDRGVVSSPSRNKLYTFPLRPVYTPRRHLPLNIKRTGSEKNPPPKTPKPKGPIKLLAALFIQT